jgi:L-iditol 2-dehydrogenase
MKAVRVLSPGSTALVELPIPAPEAGEVLVRVRAAALCATDRKLAAGGTDPPLVPGHEVVGTLPEGGLVGVHPDLGCGRCAACTAGFQNRCAERISIGLDRDGGLAEWLIAPRAHLVPIDGIPPHVAAALEPLACCLHATSLLDVRPGDLALVVGAGAMGILCLWALQAAGATVAVAQRSEPRRTLAVDLGADAVPGPDDHVADVLGAPPRIAIVTAPGAESLRWALDEVAIGGIVHAFAGTPSGAHIDANVVHYRHLSLVGSTGSRLADYEHARDLVAAGTIDLSRLPIDVVPLEEAPAALLERPRKDVLKVVVDVGGGEND